MPHLLIQNKLSHHTQYDVLLFGYFLTPFSFLLHVKRFDSLNGWNSFDVFIDEKEKIIVDENNSSSFIKIINTTTFLLPLNNKYEQAIPKIIVQTSEASAPSELNKNCIESFAELNTEYSYQHFNSTQRRNFILTNFDEKVINAYDLLVSGAFQADLFRYCFLYINGGCYFDDKIIPKKPLRDIITPTDTLLLCKDYESDSMLNAIIMTTPRNELFLHLINECVKNISFNVPHNFDILSYTGPKLMYKFFRDKEYKFEHIIVDNNGSIYQNYQIIDKHSKEMLFNKTNTIKRSRYIDEWQNNQILFKNYVSILNLKIYVSPHPYCDSFNFFLNNTKEIIIERQDSINTWHFPVTLKIIENDSSKIKIVTTTSQRTIPLDELKVKKPTNVYLSSESINLDLENKTVVVIPSTSFFNIDNYKKTVDNAFIIMTVTSLHTPLSLIETYAEKCDAVILYNNTFSYYFCHELKKPNIFIYTHLLKVVKKCYKFIPVVVSKEINQDTEYITKLDFFKKFCNKLIKENKEDDSFFLSNVQMFYNINFETFYKEQFEKYKFVVERLNEIVKESGERLEGNIFYDHDTTNFIINKTFENKRKNLFLYSHLVTDIAEIGFNAGHSTFLYLISNPISKIQLFDLGEHKYSRLCFDYLNEQFPNRLSIIWGDSVTTLKTYKDNVNFDLIHIDGGHFRYIAESDIRNCERIASKETLIIFDDSLYDPLSSFLYELINANYIVREKPYYDTKDHLFYRYT